jgi:hypothetical protein
MRFLLTPLIYPPIDLLLSCCTTYPVCLFAIYLSKCFLIYSSLVNCEILFVSSELVSIIGLYNFYSSIDFLPCSITSSYKSGDANLSSAIPSSQSSPVIISLSPNSSFYSSIINGPFHFYNVLNASFFSDENLSSLVPLLESNVTNT